MVACNTSVSNQCYVGQFGFRNVYFSVVSVGYYFVVSRNCYSSIMIGFWCNYVEGSGFKRKFKIGQNLVLAW